MNAIRLKAVALMVIVAVAPLLAGDESAGRSPERGRRLREQRDLYFATELERRGRLSLAARAYEDFVRMRPDHVRAGELTLKTAQLRFREGDYAGCMRNYADYMALYSYEGGGAEARYWTARALHATGDYSAALQEFRDVTARPEWSGSAFSIHSRYMEGLCLLAMGEPEKASAVLSEVAALYRGLRIARKVPGTFFGDL